MGIIDVWMATLDKHPCGQVIKSRKLRAYFQLRISCVPENNILHVVPCCIYM